MGLPAFDTLAFVKKLVAVGVEQRQAEAQAELQSQILSELINEKLATKKDINDLKTATKQEFTEVKANIKQLDEKFSGKFNLLGWMLGFLLAAVLAILFKLF